MDPIHRWERRGPKYEKRALRLETESAGPGWGTESWVSKRVRLRPFPVGMVREAGK